MGLAQTSSLVVPGLIAQVKGHDMIRHRGYGLSQIFLWGMSPILLLKSCRDAGWVHARVSGFGVRRESASDVGISRKKGFN